MTDHLNTWSLKSSWTNTGQLKVLRGGHTLAKKNTNKNFVKGSKICLIVFGEFMHLWHSSFQDFKDPLYH